MVEAAFDLFMALLGFAGGLAVGSGMVALLIVFDLIPRLAQLANAYRKSLWFETAIVGGSMFWTFADFFNWRMFLPGPLILPLTGIFNGMFIGMLAAALTEVMNVLPIFAKRMGLSNYLSALVMAMVLGKTLGSLFDWLMFQW
ncbi:stage V sporulation protein AB [Paenibacillus beijingensis]|uniref:Stage V sporulation protein AB n=1 Tax=Paenibacillus beijingensis TaxID=1126833 RepID=A0A0D5NQG7_9BACL|nr:stage V sporulation protein AB [Paenibacillus beijingensis]AJY77222.1 stage V sporulation protein AB [Paenibacillus beijingensis]